ncbi:hypothetical protein KCU77_g2302, partial [Aureobasidium melanogenum]
MNSIKAVSVLSFLTTLAAAWPMNTTSTSWDSASKWESSTKSPSSSWISTESSSSTKWESSSSWKPSSSSQWQSSSSPSSTWASSTASSSSSVSYACNPAHSYPGGVSCISTSGHLTLVSPSPSPTYNGHD